MFALNIGILKKDSMPLFLIYTSYIYIYLNNELFSNEFHIEINVICLFTRRQQTYIN